MLGMPDFIIHHGKKRRKKRKKDSAKDESNPDLEETVQVSAALDNWYLIPKYLWTRRRWLNTQEVSRGRNPMQHRTPNRTPMQEDKKDRRHHNRRQRIVKKDKKKTYAPSDPSWCSA